MAEFWRSRTAVLAVYARLLAAQARSQAQYRASFGCDLVGSFLFAMSDLVGVLVMYHVTRSLGGFTFSEALLMAGLATSGFALAELWVGGVDRMRIMIRAGLVDALLVRPLSVLGQLLVMDFAPRRIGRVLVTGTVLAVAASRAGIGWTPAKVLLILVTPISAAVLFAAVFVATATVAFWWVESGEFSAAITYGGREFTSYPMTVYDTVTRGLLGFGVGYAFSSYYPALTLLGRADPLGLPTWAGWGSPVVALAAVGLAAVAWRIGIRHYRSTGS